MYDWTLKTRGAAIYRNQKINSDLVDRESHHVQQEYRPLPIQYRFIDINLHGMFSLLHCTLSEIAYNNIISFDIRYWRVAIQNNMNYLRQLVFPNINILQKKISEPFLSLKEFKSVPSVPHEFYAVSF